MLKVTLGYTTDQTINYPLPKMVKSRLQKFAQNIPEFSGYFSK